MCSEVTKTSKYYNHFLIKTMFNSIPQNLLLTRMGFLTPLVYVWVTLSLVPLTKEEFVVHLSAAQPKLCSAISSRGVGTIQII